MLYRETEGQTVGLNPQITSTNTPELMTINQCIFRLFSTRAARSSKCCSEEPSTLLDNQAAIRGPLSFLLPLLSFPTALNLSLFLPPSFPSLSLSPRRAPLGSGSANLLGASCLSAQAPRGRADALCPRRCGGVAAPARGSEEVGGARIGGGGRRSIPGRGRERRSPASALREDATSCAARLFSPRFIFSHRLRRMLIVVLFP